MGLHSYYVKYIERSGHVVRRLFMARNPEMARERASESGCEDILGAKPARFFTRFFISLGVAAALILLAVIISMLLA